MSKNNLKREKANDLLKEYNESLNSLERIRSKIDYRFNDLVNRYREVVKINPIIDSTDKVKYIRRVEDYIESQNKIIQGELF